MVRRVVKDMWQKPTRKRLLLLYFILLFFNVAALAGGKTDSLRIALSNAQTDEARLPLLVQLAQNHLPAQPKTALALSEEAIQLADKLRNEDLKMEAFAHAAKANIYLGNFEKANQQLRSTLAYFKTKRDLSKIAFIQNNLGLTEDAAGNYEEAIDWFSASLDLARKNEDFVNTANAMSNLGLIHLKLKQYNEAIIYLEEVLQLAQKKLYIGLTLNTWLNLGNVYMEKGENAKASAYFEQVLLYSSQTKDSRQRSYAQNNLAEICLLNKEYTKAASLFEQSLQAKQAQGDKWGQIYSYIGLSEAALQQRLIAQALVYGQQGLALAQAMGAKKEIILALQQMTKLYKANGMLAEALNTSELTHYYQDSLYNEQNLQRLLKLKTKRSQDKQLLENKLSQEERKNQLLENEKNIAGIHTRNWILAGISFTLLLAIGLILLLYKYYHAKHNAFIELRQLHEEIALQQEKLSISNEALEKTVLERTASLALQNQKLEEYAFFNAHQVRRPLANILGLAYLLEKESNLDNIYIYVDLMYQSAKELDEIVKQLNDLLTADDFVDFT